MRQSFGMTANRKKIRDLYQAAVDAGSDIFLTNSFAVIDRD